MIFGTFKNCLSVLRICKSHVSRAIFNTAAHLSQARAHVEAARGPEV